MIRNSADILKRYETNSEVEDGQTTMKLSRDVVSEMTFRGRPLGFNILEEDDSSTESPKDQVAPHVGRSLQSRDSKQMKGSGAAGVILPSITSANETDECKNKKPKKQVQFNPIMTMHIYYKFNTEENLHYTDDDRMEMKKYTAETVRAIRDMLKNDPSPNKVLYAGHSVVETDLFLRALECRNGVAESGDIIGIEHMIGGHEYAARLHRRKRKIPVLVVREWHNLLHTLEMINVGKERVVRDEFEEASQILASLYSSLAQESVLRARRRAELVHRLNEASIIVAPGA